MISTIIHVLPTIDKKEVNFGNKAIAICCPIDHEDSYDDDDWFDNLNHDEIEDGDDDDGILLLSFLVSFVGRVGSALFLYFCCHTDNYLHVDILH